MKFLNEADIQGYLFHLCLCAGIDAHLEYVVLLPCGKRLIADLVVFHGDKPACLVEVKKSKRRGINTNTRQYKKYTSANMPFIYCRNESQIDSTMQQIKILLERGGSLAHDVRNWISAKTTTFNGAPVARYIQSYTLRQNTTNGT